MSLWKITILILYLIPPSVKRLDDGIITKSVGLLAHDNVLQIKNKYIVYCNQAKICIINRLCMGVFYAEKRCNAYNSPSSQERNIFLN